MRGDRLLGWEIVLGNELHLNLSKKGILVSGGALAENVTYIYIKRTIVLIQHCQGGGVVNTFACYC